MRANRFLPAFDQLCTRITPSSGGVTSIPATPTETTGSPIPGDDTQIPTNHYSDSDPSDQDDPYFNPPMPVNYSQ